MRPLALPAIALLLLAACSDGDEPKGPPATEPSAKNVDEEKAAPSAGPTAVEDSPKALMHLIEELSRAAVAGESEKALAMSRALLLPEPAQWFDRVFGEEIGERLSLEYAERAAQIDTLPALFPGLHEKGQTKLLVERHEDPKDPAATGYQSIAMGSMKLPTRLYSVRFLEPEQESGFSLWSFVHVDGTFRFAGKMRMVNPEKRSPHAAMLGELRRRDAEQFLDTGKFADDK